MIANDISTRLGTLMNLCLSLFVTLLIIAIIGLFAWSNLLNIGFIRNTFTATFNGSTIVSEDDRAYTFAIVNWIMNLWDASSYSIAVCILCFSLIWPYIRLIFLLLLIWLPTSTVARHRGLIVLDIFGKMAFYDVFLFIIIINMFAQTLTDSSQFEISASITVEPIFGIAVYSSAVILSILISLLVLFLDHHYSKMDVLIRVSTIEMQEDYKPPCCPHWLQLHAPLIISMFNCDNGCLHFCQLFITRIIMLANLIVAFVCIIGAYTTDCLQVTYKDNSTTSTYSIVDFGSDAIDNTDVTSIQTWLAIVYELVVVVFPIITCLLLMALWFIPIPHFMYVRIRPIIRMFYTWCSLDLMFVAIITSAYQLPSFYSWLVDNKYTSFCSNLTQYSSDGCSSIEISVLTGTWFALLGILSLWIISTYSIYFTDTGSSSQSQGDYQHVRTDDEDSYQGAKV